jgi:CheY-like chemotaxis protein
VARGTGDSADTRHARVLLVEDNLVNQLLARKLLERLGYGVVIAGNGREALAALKGAPYDLVLMDCQMPIMDGFEATKCIRNPLMGALDPEIPIIAMTANATHSDRDACLAVGMNDYLAKPVNTPELKRCLERNLALRAPSAGAPREFARSDTRRSTR